MNLSHNLSSSHLIQYGVEPLLVFFEIITIGILGYFFSRWLSLKSKAALARLPHVDATMAEFSRGVVHYLLMTLVFVVCLSKLGVQTTSIAAVLGAAGLALGLALQGALANVASGVLILVLRPFSIGDFIAAQDIQGVVESISLFATRLRDRDGVYVMAPNSLLWNRTIKNFSRNEKRRVVLNIGLESDHEFAFIKEIILHRLKEIESINDSKFTNIYITDLQPASFDIEIQFWCSRSKYKETKSVALTSLKSAFKEHGVEISTPQQKLILNQKNACPSGFMNSQGSLSK